MRLFDWLRKKKHITITPEVDPPVSIAPDPDMAPGTWYWKCTESGCGAGNQGEAQAMRAESMGHCLTSGHGIYASMVE